MPRKTKAAKEQSEQFKAEAQKLIDAGELISTEEGVEAVMFGISKLRADWF